MSEGLDASLFPSVTPALINLEDFPLAMIGTLATVQLIFQAIAGPIWGILAARGILTRKVILIIATFFQGLATLVMWINLDTYWILPWRAVNGIMLAGLRPIANSIVGDRFDDEVRGKYFSQIMSGLQFGVLTGSGCTTLIAQQEIFPGFLGWKLAFIVIGVFTMALAPCVAFFLRAPPVKVAEGSKAEGSCSELRTLCRLFQRKTFAMLVFQGCFGLIPWRAFDFRTLFLNLADIPDWQISIITVCGGIGATIGSLIGGPIGDCLGVCWPLHGRILTAEMSVYGGIPIAYLSFMVLPDDVGFNPFLYYLILTTLLGLVATWTPAATNSPILCSLAAEDERALILSWQTSLEGAVGALGPIMFTNLLTWLGYDRQCLDDDFKKENSEMCNNLELAGLALFLTSCVPWAVCGLMYSSLHYTYPRDLASIQAEQGQQEIEVGSVAS